MQKVTVHAVYTGLMDARRGEPVEAVLATILASWSQGFGALPDWLGLGKGEFSAMMSHHFPKYDPTRFNSLNRWFDPQRIPEIWDLRKLLLDNRSQLGPSEVWMADIVSAGCQGSDHLWQDLGLWNRAELTALMRDSFAPLAARNDKDMKWKKFLYRQLCAAEGLYICRSPSCETCVDYRECFGSG